MLSAALPPTQINIETGGPWDGIVGAAIQAGILAIGGIWAFVLYLRRREFQPRIRVGATARLSAPGVKPKRPARLFVRIHIINESGARVEVNARIVYWSVTLDPNSYPEFKELEPREFPMDYAYGVVRADGVMTGPGGVAITNRAMEASECIETEVLLCPDPLPDLIGVRMSVERERVGRDWPWFWNKKSRGLTSWESFAYIDPDVVTGTEYVALTSHEAST